MRVRVELGLSLALEGAVRLRREGEGHGQVIVGVVVLELGDEVAHILEQELPGDALGQVVAGFVDQLGDVIDDGLVDVVTPSVPPMRVPSRPG